MLRFRAKAGYRFRSGQRDRRAVAFPVLRWSRSSSFAPPGVPLNKLSSRSCARAEADGRKLGVRIRRGDRRPYHELYRERFGGRCPACKGRCRAELQHRLKRPFGVVRGQRGSGCRAQRRCSRAALLSGLQCIQKNDHPVTVGTGFHRPRSSWSPSQILFTGIDRPDAVLVTSLDGLKKARERGDLEHATRC
jgi:hypothetical protein